MSILPCIVQFLQPRVMPWGIIGTLKDSGSIPGNSGGRIAVSRYCSLTLASATLVLVGDPDGGGGKSTEEIAEADAVDAGVAWRFGSWLRGFSSLFSAALPKRTSMDLKESFQFAGVADSSSEFTVFRAPKALVVVNNSLLGIDEGHDDTHRKGLRSPLALQPT